MATIPPSRQDEDSSDPSEMPLRILLVEDDQELREGLAETLRLHGMDVTDVATGIAFYKALRAAQFDIAILDVNLPDTNGFELAREISGDGRMGIVMLTARTSAEDRRQGYSEGADLYMTKPVDTQELLLALGNLGRRRRPEKITTKPSDAGPKSTWLLDRANTRLISPDGREIGLTGRELMLLEEFAKAGNGRISRSELSIVMGYGAPGPDNRNLDVVLHRLQAKAIRAGVALPLHNVQSVGIRFNAPLAVV